MVSLGNGKSIPTAGDRSRRAEKEAGGVLGGGCCASWLLQAPIVSIN